jgi:hypothetical protein
LGEKGLVSLRDRLHHVAASLRQPFLDFIADLRKIQTDQLGWWSSSCSWKDTGASDLFLLICYEHLVNELRRDHARDESPLIVVIEDPWLFRQLHDAYGMMREVEFRGHVSLWPLCLRSMVLGTGARIIWTLRLLKTYLLQVWHWEWDAPLSRSGPLIALYSYPQRRCLEGTEGWGDPYLGDLKDVLEKGGYSVCRFSPPEVGGFEEALERRRHYFRPLILYLTFGQVLRAFVATWRIIWPSGASVSDRPVGWLLRREWWKDRWRSSYLLHRLFFHGVGAFLGAERPSVVVFPYENQPWEKMLIVAAQAHGVSTLGYQHGAGLAQFMLSYFHGKGEVDFEPLPDRIVTSGPYSHEVLSRGESPTDRLVVGGSLRFQHLLRERDKGPVPLPSSSPQNPVRVLVALPIESFLAQHLLHALRLAFPDGGHAEGLEFAIKSHPMHPVKKQSLRWPVKIVGGTFEEAIRPCSVLIYTGTSAGMEALAMGRIVLRYRPELLLDLDVSAFMTGEAIVDCGDHDLRTKLLVTAQEVVEGALHRLECDEALRRIFTPVKEDTWLAIIHDLARK